MKRKILIKISIYLVFCLLLSISWTFITNLIHYYVNRDGHELPVFLYSSILCLVQFSLSITAFLNLVNKIRDNLILRFLVFNLSSIICPILVLYKIESNMEIFSSVLIIMLPYMLCLLATSVKFTLFLKKLARQLPYSNANL
jgi:hypothetical protein